MHPRKRLYQIGEGKGSNSRQRARNLTARDMALQAVEIAGRGYLTAPSARPLCHWRCIARKAAISGTTASSDPVISSG